MAISMIGTPSSLFNLLGKCAKVIGNLDDHQDTQYTALTSSVSGVVAGLQGEPDVQAITGAGYLGALNSTAGSLGSLMQRQAAAIINRLVYRDNPRLGQSLTSQQTLESIKEVIRQMNEGGFTIRAQTITGSVTEFTTPAKGNGTLNVSVRRPYDGKVLEQCYAEDIDVYCTVDSYTGGAIRHQETLTFSGSGSQTEPFSFDWPTGSDGSLDVSCIDGAQDNSGGNILTNSGFDAFTDNVPDQWELVTGTAGTHVLEDTGIIFRGASSLKIVGDGSNLTALRQHFDDSTDGTAGTLDAATQYSLVVWMRRDGIVPDAGTLRLSLVDGTGVVVQDQAGNQNLVDVDLTTLSTTYAPVRLAIRTPLSLPDDLYLKIELTVALTSGRAIYLDLMGLGQMGQLYTSGPYVACHSGSAPFVLDDYSRATITNSRGAGGTLSTFHTALARLLPEVLGSEILFPTSSSPNIPDSLIA